MYRSPHTIYNSIHVYQNTGTSIIRINFDFFLIRNGKEGFLAYGLMPVLYYKIACSKKRVFILFIDAYSYLQGLEGVFFQKESILSARLPPFYQHDITIQ